MLTESIGEEGSGESTARAFFISLIGDNYSTVGLRLAGFFV
jgi:hypothetical protein